MKHYRTIIFSAVGCLFKLIVDKDQTSRYFARGSYWEPITFTPMKGMTMKPIRMMSADVDRAAIQRDKTTAQANADTICGIFRADPNWARFGELGILTACETPNGWALGCPSPPNGTIYLTRDGFEWIERSIGGAE